MYTTGALILALLAGLLLPAEPAFLSVFLPHTDFHIPLNDRQRAILRDRGLPEVYEELDAAQRDMILSIEELLEEVEEKYGKTMLFENYRPGTAEKPCTVSLQFRDPDWTDDLRNATVVRTETDGIVSFYDDYVCIELGRKLADYLTGLPAFCRIADQAFPLS